MVTLGLVPKTIHKYTPCVAYPFYSTVLISIWACVFFKDESEAYLLIREILISNKSI